MKPYFRPYIQFAAIFVSLLFLSSCSTQRASTPQSNTVEEVPTTNPRSQEPIDETPSTVNEAILAFKNAGLVVESQRKESLSQDWFPGTIEANSFKTCNSCKKSYVFRFDTKANYERAFEDYSFVGEFHVYGNSNRILLIIPTDYTASFANDYGEAFGAR